MAWVAGVFVPLPHGVAVTAQMESHLDVISEAGPPSRNRVTHRPAKHRHGFWRGKREWPLALALSPRGRLKRNSC